MTQTREKSLIKIWILVVNKTTNVYIKSKVWIETFNRGHLKLNNKPDLKPFSATLIKVEPSRDTDFNT